MCWWWPSARRTLASARRRVVVRGRLRDLEDVFTMLALDEQRHGARALPQAFEFTFNPPLSMSPFCASSGFTSAMGSGRVRSRLRPARDIPGTRRRFRFARLPGVPSHFFHEIEQRRRRPVQAVGDDQPALCAQFVPAGRYSESAGRRAGEDVIGDRNQSRRRRARPGSARWPVRASGATYSCEASSTSASRCSVPLNELLIAVPEARAPACQFNTTTPGLRRIRPMSPECFEG